MFFEMKETGCWTFRFQVILSFLHLLKKLFYFDQWSCLKFSLLSLEFVFEKLRFFVSGCSDLQTTYGKITVDPEKQLETNCYYTFKD